MAKYLLHAPHYTSDGRYLTAGTAVGDDTNQPWNDEVTNQMEGLDDEGREKVQELHKRLYNADAPWHTPEMEERKRQREAQQRESEAAPEAAPKAEPPKPAAPLGGTTGSPRGVVSPKTEPKPADEPNKQQYPKDG